MTDEEKALIDKTIQMNDVDFKEFAKTLTPEQLVKLYKLSTDSLKETFSYVKEKTNKNT